MFWPQQIRLLTLEGQYNIFSEKSKGPEVFCSSYIEAKFDMSLSSAWNPDNANIMALTQKYISKPKIFQLDGRVL